MRTVHQSSTTAFPREFEVLALDDKDPNAGGASHLYVVRHPEHGDVARIQFQHGPRNTAGSIPGTFACHLLDILIDQLESFQEGPFACRENDQVLAHLRTAAALQDHRAQQRAVRGVLGRNVK